MAEFTVTSSDLLNKATELETKNKMLREKIGQLEQEEAGLQSMWEGDAHDAFSTSFKNDKVKMELFAQAIDNYVMALRNIAAKYQQAESTNVMTAQSS